MKYDEFLKSVEQRSGVSEREEAERTAVAVLQNLCDRLTGDEAKDLLAQLPYQLKTAVIVSPSAQRISSDEFVERVASSLDTTPEEARSRVRAVFGTIREAVTPGEFEDVLAQLDPEYADLIA
jgi:uncharacterized protein (DUF2267 family)